MFYSALVLFAAVALAACGSRDAAVKRDGVADVEASDSASGAAKGHVVLTGDANVDTDFAVQQCTIGPPGDGLLSGYHMNAKNGRGTLELLSISIKDYERDGVFSPVIVAPAKGLRPAKQAIAGPVMISLNRENATTPLVVLAKPESKLTITIADSGASGTAEFTDLTSPIAMEDFNIESKGRTKGKAFSGALSWKCGSVQHVDAKTSEAAKGMLKGLTPLH